MNTINNHAKLLLLATSTRRYPTADKNACDCYIPQYARNKKNYRSDRRNSFSGAGSNIEAESFAPARNSGRLYF
ncbi:MAG: hypothetical protein K8S55_08315 [Phycisphaerae bacterium]|nr:hypothetical protein [Phycisphaerae bacterium]